MRQTTLDLIIELSELFWQVLMPNYTFYAVPPQTIQYLYMVSRRYINEPLLRLAHEMNFHQHSPVPLTDRFGHCLHSSGSDCLHKPDSGSLRNSVTDTGPDSDSQHTACRLDSDSRRTGHLLDFDSDSGSGSDSHCTANRYRAQSPRSMH